MRNSSTNFLTSYTLSATAVGYYEGLYTPKRMIDEHVKIIISNNQSLYGKEK